MSKNVKSVLTTAMLNAEAAPETDAETPETNEFFTIRIPKYVIKKALIGSAIGAVVGFAAHKLLSVDVDEETETTED